MNRKTRILLAAWLIFSGSAGSPTPCLADTAVTLNPAVEVSRFAVRLSDLFAGVPAEIDRDIAQAPPPCKPAIYSEAVLTKLAATYRLDWKMAGEADHAVVTSACTRISSDMIRAAVAAKIKASGDARNHSFDIDFARHNLEIDLPGDQKPDFRLENFSYDPAAKSFHADLTAQTPRGPYVTPVNGFVTVKVNVPILAHRLEGGTTIGPDDLDWIQVPEERVTADVITDTDQLVGRELRRDTSEDTILHSQDVMPPILVHRGSLVIMEIETPYITITTQGKAQQDGAKGETVRAVNTQSNRVIEGTVTGPGVIEIRTMRRIASAE